AQPEILFLDEPTAGIDPQGQMEMYCLLEQLNATLTIVLVSHDMLALSTHVKSVACVNRRLHYHDHPELTHDMMKTMYPHTPGEACPVELVAHGVPHRVLKPHGQDT
ncbi:MAG: ABC transporter, partial [Desulfatitalea sp.]|nr:ABC transporter [Desulfatitalea sp.]